MVNNLKLLIKSNLKTFISIMILTMLGVGFLVGMKSSIPSLKYTINDYFDKHNVFDLELTSSMGFTEEDVTSFSNIKGITKIEGNYSKDFVVKGLNNDFVLRVHANSEMDINNIELIDGNLPKDKTEIVIEKSLYDSQNYQLGDTITLDSELLNNKEFKIVGIIKSPLYLSNNKGTTNLLSGRVNYYAYINKSAINSPLYSNIYIKIADSSNLQNIEKQIRDIGNNSIQKRYEETIKEYTEKIERSQSELDSKKQETEEKIKYYTLEIENAELQILSAEESIPTVEEARQILNNKQSELAKIKRELDSAKEQIDAAKSEYNIAKTEYDGYLLIIEELEKSDEEGAKIIADYYKSVLYYANKELENSKAELDSKEYEYNLTYQEYQKAENALNSNSPEEVIANAKRQVESKKVLLNQKKIELENKKQSINDEFISFQNQLDDAKDYLKLISSNSWSVKERKDITSYNQFLSDISRIDKIGNFFPVVFYIVAVLITLTNITRIISNDRDTIGLYKALGYSNKDIIDDYIYFSIISCLIGALLGTIIGSYLIPRIFYNVYGLIYFLPKFRFIIDYKIIIIAILLALVLVFISAYYSVRGTIKEWPAILLRPKQGSKGKRILLENIPFIWKYMNFTNKVTYRNIFKYPKRFIMTIIGISGCISLIIAGFNIKTAISNIIPMQFGHIFDITAEVFLKDSISRNQALEEKERIGNLDEIDAVMLSYIKYVYLNDTDRRANLVIPEDNDQLLDFVILEDNKTLYELTDEGAIITKKIAEIMNIKINDTVKLKDSDNNIFNIKIVAIVDNYVDNYIYITKDYYQSLLDNSPKYNALLVRTKDNNYNEQKLSEKFNLNNSVSYLVYTSTSKVMYDSLTKSLNYIVYILVVSAVILAFVVLYNLNTLNVEERKREIATIKVLGFRKKETYKYIENEIKRLTLIGIIIGIFFGYIFSNILIKNCELDNLIYDYSINYYNYLYAIIITIIFMLITSLLGRKNINKINMIESLKKVE